MYLPYLKYLGVFVLLIVIQKTFIWLLSISSYNIAPDIVLIAIIFLAIKEGKISGSIAGFIIGLTIDLLSGSFLGLAALSYCVAGFVSGFFKSDDNKYTYSYNFLSVVLIGTVVSNILYYVIFFQGSNLTLFDILFRYILPTSAYTVLISSVYIFFPKKKQDDRVY